MLRLGTIVIGADDVARGVEFWRAALGYRVVTFDDADDDFTILVPPSGEGTRVAIHRSEVPAGERPRLHVDLVVDDAAEQQREVERLVRLGATRVDWPVEGDVDFVVLADTEANRFCVVNAGHTPT